jgi:uncharacterized paraquat-inducible protein A
MQYMTKRFHCHGCNQDFERIVLEAAVTAACPRCKPLVYLLEAIGLTPKQALVLTLCAVGVGLVASKS